MLQLREILQAATLSNCRNFKAASFLEFGVWTAV